MRELLPLLPRPSRYIGIEEGAVHKTGQHLDFHCALAFPDTYEVGMSYLGQKILYTMLNSHETWWAERVMAPCRDAGEILRKHNTLLATLESDTPLAKLHCIGFSITHELCYTNVLYMLDLAGIPLRASQRLAAVAGAEKGDSLTAWPIIVAGGGATLSAEPLAPFMDLMVLGEGEESMADIARLLITARAENWTRTRFLHESRHIPGVYVPSLFEDATEVGSAPRPLLADYTSPCRRIMPDFNEADYPVQQVVPIGAVHNRLSLEIARGCTRGCRFCHAGMVYRPVRERSLNNLQTLLENCLTETGFDEVSYLSLSTGDFSALKTLFMTTVDRCAQEQISVSLPSLRVGSIDDSIMERMAGIRRTGATLAPEAGSQRLRDVINKGITEEELLLHVQKLIEHGWQQVKLYFMIGLPTETQEDLDAIVDLCRKVRDAGGRGNPRLQVTVAISPFVPKPYTPFQWEPQLTLAEIKQRIFYLRDLCKQQKCVKMRWHEPVMSHLEGILSRGDRRLADVVEKAYRKGGIFASWMDGFRIEPWQEAMEECGLKVDDYTGARNVDGPLPWDHLEAGVSIDFLRRERERALAEKITDDCRYQACRQCGACDTKAGPSRLARLSPETQYANILNLPQRDQEAHTPRRDENGKLFCPTGAAKPPSIAPELAIKAVELRIWHTREGTAAFLSQLELQAILERALRRADLPMAFSQGFHPLPLISFGRALPVGVSSKAEWFAVTLRKPLGADMVAQRLAPCLPRGMKVLLVTPVPKGKRTEQAVAECFIAQHTGNPEERAAFCEAWKDFAATDSMLWTRETKKGERTTDIRALVSRIDVQENGAVEWTADWEAGYLSPLSLMLALMGCKGNIREEDVLPKLQLIKTKQVFADGSVYPC